jgi:hypothetical protein
LNSPEEWRRKNLFQTFILDVVNSEMTKYTRFNITSIVDVEISSTTGETTTNVWSIIPKITDENWFVIS